MEEIQKYKGEYKKNNSMVDSSNSHRIHVHSFQTITDIADEHQHLMTGVTGPAIMRNGSHIHRIMTRTSFDPKEGRGGHWHSVEVTTGPDIDLPEGQHTHQVYGRTSNDLGHCHAFNTVTDTAPETMCADHYEYDGIEM